MYRAKGPGALPDSKVIEFGDQGSYPYRSGFKPYRRTTSGWPFTCCNRFETAS